MALLEEIICRQRIDIADSDLAKISLVCCEELLEDAFAYLSNFPHIEVERVCYLPFFPFEHVQEKFNGIPVECIDPNCLNLTIYLKNGEKHSNFSNLAMLYIARNNPDNVFYYLSPSESQNTCKLKFKPLENFYNNHKKELDNACNLLSDENSKKVFMQRVKAYETGDFGYLHFTSEPVYFPKKFQHIFKKGDFVIDAGISGDIFELEKYSSLVGSSGKIYAFEASPIEYAKAKENISKSFAQKNTELLCLGLWENATTMDISVGNSGSSLLRSGAAGTVEAKLVALDDFVKENKIKKVDHIKMDIEGAELQALIGAEKTIKKYCPNMAICVYHSAFHMWALINYIESLNLGYEYYLYHHAPSSYDTVLYAIRTDKFKFLRGIGLFFKKYLDKYLLKTKRVLIYGAGCNFEHLYSKGHFKDMNVVAVTDIKFKNVQKIKEYTAIPVDEIRDLQPDIVYVTLACGPAAFNTVSNVLGSDVNKVKFFYL